MAEATKVLDPRAAGARRLEGKIAIITGAGQGHGRATARRFAQEGAKIMIGERYEPGAARTRNEIIDFGGECEFFLGDMADVEAVQRMMKATKERFGRIDILVNNVGGTQGGKKPWEWTVEELQSNVRNNLWTCLYCCWAVMPYMVEQQSGSIINFASHAVRGTRRLPYAASKGAVMAITTSLSLELAPYNVRVNAVVPHASTRAEGDVLINRFGVVQEDTSAREFAIVPGENPDRNIPLQRPGHPEEIASAVAFLASDDASFTTGEIICCGGGAFCRI